MRSIISVILVLFVAAAVFAQRAPDVLATATGHTFKLTDLAPETQAAVNGLPAAIAKARTGLLDQMTDEALLEAEAKTRGIALEKLVTDIASKVAEPTEAEIKSVYDANLAALNNRPLAEVRKPIVDFLKQQAGGKAVQDLIESLKPKHKVTKIKDVNAAGLLPTDGLVSIDGATITVQQFETKNRLALFEVAAEVNDMLMSDLDDLIFTTLVADEAKSLNIDASSLMACEISDKLKTFSDDERSGLEDAFESKLYAKYKLNIVYKEPEPVVESISADDDPAQGPVAAPVTIIMFSDFQCPACSAAHPSLKTAMAVYPGKIKFVVRDFPLTRIHENAFRSALAAGAANAQGKFFEYIDVLYKNQKALDDASLKRYAADLGLNVKQFDIDFNSEKLVAEVKKDMSDGDAYEINSTPTIFVNGVRVRNLSVKGFRKAIDRALAK